MHGGFFVLAPTAPSRIPPGTLPEQRIRSAERVTAMERILRESERKHVTGIGRVVWWRLERAGRVPRRVQISARAVGWLESEIQTWLKERAEAR